MTNDSLADVCDPHANDLADAVVQSISRDYPTGWGRAPAPALSSDQTRFLWILQAGVTKYQWLFGDSTFRVYTENGHTATIRRDCAFELSNMGLIDWGHGFAYCTLTEAGKAVR